MRRALSLVMFLALAAPLAGAHAAVPQGRTGAAQEIHRIDAQIARANRLMSEWRFSEAFHIAESLYQAHPGLPAVEYLAGKAKFYQQDYAGAVALMTRATAGHPTDDPILRYAEATGKITRGYVSRSSAHFEVRVPKGVDEILLPYALDTLEKAYRNVGGDFDWYPKRRVVVEVYPSAADLSAATGLTVKAIKTSGTIAICKHDKLMITNPGSLLRGYSWLDTVTHEYVHFVIMHVSHNTVPIWLHEGLAKFEETRWDGAGGRAISPYAEGLLAQAIAGKRKFITFKQMYPSMALLPSQDDTALAFAEVESAVSWIVKDHGGYPTIRKLMAELKDGKTVPQAIKGALGLSLDGFQAAWRTWLKRRPLHTDPAATARHLTFKGDAPRAGKKASGDADVDDPKARRFAHLGELLRMRGREKAAAVEYRKAYALVGPKAPLLSDKLALTLMNLKDYDAARKILEAAVAPNPTFVTTYVHLGRLYFLMKKWDLAEQAYVKAVGINPFDPEIHAGLATLYKQQGQDALMKREAQVYGRLKQAQADGWSQDDAGAAPTAPEGDVGWLSIQSTPWARVIVDGHDSGMTTPVFRLALAPGDHHLVLQSDDGQQKKTVQVKITKGDENKLTVKLD